MAAILDGPFPEQRMQKSSGVKNPAKRLNKKDTQQALSAALIKKDAKATTSEEPEAKSTTLEKTQKRSHHGFDEKRGITLMPNYARDNAIKLDLFGPEEPGFLYDERQPEVIGTRVINFPHMFYPRSNVRVDDQILDSSRRTVNFDDYMRKFG